MDAIYEINNVAAYNQRVVAAYESHISDSMYASDDMDELESQFNSKIGQFKDRVTQNTNQVANILHSYYPNPYDSDYWYKRECYEQLSEYACAEIEDMDNQFDSAFSRLNNLFRRLSTWLRNKVKQVYTAVKGFFRKTITSIRRWFS